MQQHEKLLLYLLFYIKQVFKLNLYYIRAYFLGDFDSSLFVLNETRRFSIGAE